MGASQSVDKVHQHLQDKPVVVIIGGGTAGVVAATALESHVNVVLIDRRDHLYHHVAALRATVEPSVSHQLTIPYSRLLKHGHFIHAEVTEVNPNGVKVAGREELIHFDYCLVSAGFGNTFPEYTATARAKDVSKTFEESAKAVEAVSSFPSSPLL